MPREISFLAKVLLVHAARTVLPIDILWFAIISLWIASLGLIL